MTAAITTEIAPTLPNRFNTALTTDRYSTPIWSGYLHNAAALTALTLFLLSLRWIPGTVRRWRVRDGCCPSCRYSLAGLPPHARACPECGSPL